MIELYNPKFKERFIEQSLISKGSQEVYKYVLSKAAFWENRLEKDLSDFTHSEYDLLLSGLEGKSYSSVIYQHNILSNYVTFAIQNNFTDQQTNFTDAFTTDVLKKYVDMVYTKNKIMSRDDLDDLISLCENMQDAAPIVLIYFAGIDNNMEEIRNLTRDDINREEGYLLLRKDNIERKVFIEDKYLEVIKDASLETEYLVRNGDIKSNAKFKTVPLEYNGYVLKNRVKKGFHGKVSDQLIRQRIKKIASWWGNEYITPTSIMISGMLEYTKKYMEEQNKELDELIGEDYKKIGKQFGISELNWFTTKRRILQHLKG